jgi:hypothetical protein
MTSKKCSKHSHLPAKNETVNSNQGVVEAQMINKWERGPGGEVVKANA